MTDEIKWGRGLTGPYLESINLPETTLVKFYDNPSQAGDLFFISAYPEYHLPADSIVYQVLDFNEENGTEFVPWFGGKAAPDDWDGGECLFRCDEFWVPAGPVSFENHNLIIGYTRKAQSKPEPTPIDWSKPIELIADGTPLVLVDGPDFENNRRVGREDGAPLSKPDGSDSNSYWYFTKKGEFAGSEASGPLIRNRAPKPEPDGSEYVSVKRMTTEEWNQEIASKTSLQPYSRSVTTVVRFLLTQGLVKETPVERFKRENPGLTPDELLAKALEGGE